MDAVARSLGMSKRTLARQLSDEGLNFTEVLQQLRRDLAVRYLDDPKLQISKIAWLLGFNEVSAFNMHSSDRCDDKTGGHCPTRWPAQAVNVEGRVNQNEEISRKEDEAAQCRQTRH